MNDTEGASARKPPTGMRDCSTSRATAIGGCAARGDGLQGQREGWEPHTNNQARTTRQGKELSTLRRRCRRPPCRARSAVSSGCRSGRRGGEETGGGETRENGNEKIDQWEDGTQGERWEGAQRGERKGHGHGGNNGCRATKKKCASGASWQPASMVSRRRRNPRQCSRSRETPPSLPCLTQKHTSDQAQQSDSWQRNNSFPRWLSALADCCARGYLIPAERQLFTDP